MGDNNHSTEKSRRSFLTGGFANKPKKDLVKMLTSDGKIVEIERSVLDAASNKKRASNEEIYQWMNNPSKKNS